MSGAVRIAGEPGLRGTFAVESVSTPGHLWYVEWISGGSHWCPCPRHQSKQTCRHTEAVEALVIEEARAQVAASTPEQRALAALRLSELERIFS